MDNKETDNNRKELDLDEMEKAAGGVEDAPGTGTTRIKAVSSI